MKKEKMFVFDIESWKTVMDVNHGPSRPPVCFQVPDSVKIDFHHESQAYCPNPDPNEIMYMFLLRSRRKGFFDENVIPVLESMGNSFMVVVSFLKKIYITSPLKGLKLMYNPRARSITLESVFQEDMEYKLNEKEFGEVLSRFERLTEPLTL